MKRLMLVGGVLISTLGSLEARADPNCYLAVSVSEVARGDFYQYGLYIASPPPQPPGPGWPAPQPGFFVTFYGTRDGDVDTGAAGQTLEAPLMAGTYLLSGYQNPVSGAASGMYSRYAEITYDNGYSTLWCITNTVWVTLD